MQNKNLQTYLYRIGWDKEQFTPDRLESMLAASCLRFLGGLEDISFVFGLSEAIRKNHLDTMALPLHYATAILHDLAEELGNNTILLMFRLIWLRAACRADSGPFIKIALKQLPRPIQTNLV